MGKYLTEELLSEFLKEQFPLTTFIRNKQVPDTGNKGRPDFRSEDLKLIVEYDGDRHFTEQNTIFRDLIKDNDYSKAGYTIVRIPYFIQLDATMVTHYFGSTSIARFSKFPQGFITERCITPAKFSRLGIHRFKLLLSTLPSETKKEVLQSLINRCSSKGASQITRTKEVMESVPVGCECVFSDPIGALKEFIDECDEAYGH